MAVVTDLEIGASQENFRTMFKTSNHVLWFWAPWCRPCRIMQLIVDPLAKMPGEFNVIKVNIDEHRAIAVTYDIHSIPTTLLYKAGEEVDKIFGAIPEAELQKAIKEAFELE